jgi:hypothetical protein
MTGRLGPAVCLICALVLVVRREKFEAAHPEIVISVPDYSKGEMRWAARRRGGSANILATAYDLEDLLDELEWRSAS